MIAQDFYTFISGKAAVTAIASTRIYPQMLPQTTRTFPAVTFSQEDNSDQQLLDGISGLREARITVDCWSYSYITTHNLADTLSDELVGFRGTFGSSTAEHIRKERETDLYESDTGLHRVNLVYFLAYY